MRREMIEALDFPRSLILQFIEDRDCPHDSLFDATDSRCSQCELNSECHWLTCLNEFSDFESKPTYMINASLRYGVQLVGSFQVGLQHDGGTCICSTCSWLREAEHLIEEFESGLPSNPYRPVH